MLTFYKYLRQRILNVIFLVFTFKFHFSCSLFDSFNYMIQIITICTCSIMGVWTCYTVLSTVRRESKLTTMVWYFTFKWYMHLKWKWKIVFYQQVNMLIFYQVNMPYYIKFSFLIFVLHKFVISGPYLIIFFANGFGFDWFDFFSCFNATFKHSFRAIWMEASFYWCRKPDSPKKTTDRRLEWSALVSQDSKITTSDWL